MELVVKNPPNAGDLRDVGSVSGLERSPGGGHSNTLQYSCLENPTNKGAWWAIANRVAKRQTRLKQLSAHTHTPLNHNPRSSRFSYIFVYPVHEASFYML